MSVVSHLLSFHVEGLGRYTSLLYQNGLNLVEVKNRTKFIKTLLEPKRFRHVEAATGLKKTDGFLLE